MTASLNQRWSAGLAGALSACGVGQVVVCPGSRSTPLALALAARTELTLLPVMDERSGAFVALGLARATGHPVAVLCTSGTAGAHFFPAVLEAEASGTPLVVLTADRPFELQGFGAPQTIDQRGLFGRHVVAEVDLSEPAAEALEHACQAVARAVHLATVEPRGPVHLNAPFREPLFTAGPQPVETPRVTRRRVARRELDVAEVAQAVEHASSGLLVCGPRDRRDGLGPALAALSARTGFPLLAEAASNVRYGTPGAVAMYDAILKHGAAARRLVPQVVLRFGQGLTLKSVSRWLDEARPRLFAFSDDGRDFDPSHLAELHLTGDVVSAVERLPGRPGASLEAQAWLGADRAVTARWLAHPGPLSEPHAARELVRALPSGSALVLSSSMPIRDVEAYAPRGPAGLRVITNRGVNGIDGVLSTALGVALANPGRPTALFIGDVALLHDAGAWALARSLKVDLTVLLTNNQGGGIFNFLPVARAEPFERLFGTPHDVDFTHLAALGGARLHRPATVEALRELLPVCLTPGAGLHLVEVRTERAQNVATHQALEAELARALDEEGPW